ncbi:MAG TPA: hypothetical protein VFG10_16170 [Saprospiraceae bacterium]|nr:hypothetical protein [Saprospiraceae bacterium]
MKRFYFLLILMMLSFSLNHIFGQGCSDAGACSIPGFKPATVTVPDKMNQFNIGISAGAADHSIFVLTPQIGYSRKFGSGFRVDGKLTTAMHGGNGILTSGLGDLFFNINYLPSGKFSFTGGLKIPLNRADRFYTDDIAFPMDYQSSLGTLDLIIGFAYQSDDWHFSFAYQQPLTQNENSFFPDSILHPESPFNDFPSTFSFERQADILLHISRVISVNDKVTFIPGLLPIYHLGKDRFRNDQDVFETIDGSAGLTLNATMYSILQMGDSGKLGINIGFPLIVRELRPDGLTRSFVVGAEYSFHF